MVMTLPRLDDLPPSALAIAAVLVLLAVVLLLRPVWLRLLGPVFVYESDRMARKGRVFLVRCLFIAALLLVIYLVYPRGVVFDVYNEEQVRKVMSQFAIAFSNGFLIAQCAVILLLTPIYMGGAITEEKEKRSLDFLLGTQLSSAEIVLGKFASRFLPLFAIVLTSLPVLAITQVWGGVDLPRVLAGGA